MGVKGGKLIALLKWVLLDVQARGVDVSTKDVQTLFQGLGTNLDKDDGLAADVCLDLIASFESFACRNGVRKFDVTCCLSKLNGT